MVSNNKSFIHNRCKFFFCLLAALGCAALNGCAVQSAVESGSFYTSEISQQRIASIASDSAEFLAWKYPPAKTTFDFAAPPADLFGIALRDRLRLHGFKVSENAGTGLRTRYITDNDSAGIRVILRIDSATYAKTYSLSANGTDLKWTSLTLNQRVTSQGNGGENK